MADKPDTSPEQQRGAAPPDLSPDPPRAPLSEQLAATVAPRQAAEADELTLFNNVSGVYEDSCECEDCEAEDDAPRDQWDWY